MSRYTFEGDGVCIDSSGKIYDRNQKNLSTQDEAEAASQCAKECIKHPTDQRGFQVIKADGRENAICMCLYDNGKVPLVYGMARNQGKLGDGPIADSRQIGTTQEQWCYALM